MAKVVVFVLLIISLFVFGCSSPEVFDAPPSYPTENLCLETGCNQCGFTMCDYVPEGKTFDEVCGKGFAKGWQCLD